jgi:hypothetical protein
MQGVRSSSLRVPTTSSDRAKRTFHQRATIFKTLASISLQGFFRFRAAGSWVSIVTTCLRLELRYRCLIGCYIVHLGISVIFCAVAFSYSSFFLIAA